MIESMTGLAKSATRVAHSWGSMENLCRLVAFCVVVYLLSPLTDGHDFFSVQTGKVCVAVYGVCGYFLLRLVEVWRRKEWIRMRLTVLDWVVAGYVCYWLVRVWMNWEEADRWVVLAGVLSWEIYVMVRREGKKMSHWLLWALPILLAWQWGFGLMRLERGMTVADIAGSFLNTGIWGCFLTCLFAGMFGGVCEGRGGLLRWWLAVGCVLCLAMLVFARSRAAWVGVLAGGGYVCWQFWRRFPLWVRGVLLVLVVFVGMIAVRSTLGKADSARGRVLVWKVELRMGQKSPWGLGVDGFHRNYMACQADYLEMEGSDREVLLADENEYVFNEYLRVWVEMGWPGATFVLLLLFGLTWGWWRCPLEEREKNAWMWAMLSAWGVFALFSYPVSNVQTRMLLIVPLGMVAGLFPAVSSFGIRRGVLLLAGCGMVGVLWETAVFHRACVEWNTYGGVGRRLELERLKPLRNTSFVLTNAALRLNTEGRFAEAERVADRGRRLYHSYFAVLELGKSLEQQERWREADWMWREAGWLLPNRFAPLFLRMEMWRRLGEWERAAELAQEILAKPVKVRSSRLTYMLMRARETLRLREEDFG